MLDSFLERVFQGMRASAFERECNLLLACGTGSPYGIGFGKPAWPLQSAEVDFVPVGPWNCDGLIVIHPIGTPKRIEYATQLAKTGYPVVFTGNCYQGTTITADNESGIYQAVDHLFAHGHRKIAFIAGRQDELDGDSSQRFQAYKKRLSDHGLSFDPALVAVGSHTVPGGQQAMADLLQRNKSFTALVASNDESAIGAMRTMQSLGLVVPQDVAVIGFDDRVDARAQIPMLTTVHFPMFDLGYQSVDLVLQYILGKETQFQHVTIPTRLVVRESCGCLAGWNVENNTAKTVPLVERSSYHLHAQPSSVENTDTPPPFPSLLPIDQVIKALISSETQHLGMRDIEHLTTRLVESLQASLENGTPQTFSQTFQQILAHASSQNDDLFIWHEVITTLRNRLPEIHLHSPVRLTHQQVENMFDQARVAISEMSRGQSARWMVNQERIANQIGRMTSRFFTVQDEIEVYQELDAHLAEFGVSHVAVAFYENNRPDAYEWSELQSATSKLNSCEKHFLSRHFPPEGLYPEDIPYSLAILPISIPDRASGFAAFDTSNLQLCFSIVQQLSAALRGIYLYQEALAARYEAEQGRRIAEEAGRLKNRFLSWVIHELRTPLNLIYGLSDMLLHEGNQSSKEKISVNREDIERIHIGSETLVRLIRDVLDLALSEMGQLKLIREPLDLEDELIAVSSISSQLASDKGLEWEMDITRPLPKVRADQTRIRQVLLNLVSNAVKFTKRGKITLEVAPVGDQVMFSVRDTGLGIPLNEQTSIFEEFHQTERTSTRGFGGLGLGLAISKRLVEMHGGEIGVYSSGDENKGSTFYFTIPAIDTEASIASPIQTSTEATKLLVLVNQATAGQSLSRYLSEQGYQVLIHPVNGDTDWMGMVLLERPQAVVLDLTLASQWGWEILRLIKENPATHDIPVLFFSLEEGSDRGSLLELDVVTKPVQTTLLAESLVSQGLAAAKGKIATTKKILIVDDEPEILNMHARMVQAQIPNCQIFLANNGKDALQSIRKHHPDLVLLDLMMPVMDGFTVLETMREDEYSRNIPVIVLTGQSLTEEDMERLNCGVANVLGKGMYSAQETLEQISDALHRRRKAGSETQRIVLKAMSFLHANYAEPISRKDIADFVGMSERHLSRCFNQELGLTPMTYLNRYRVKQAKDSLMEGRKSITEIAEDVGFSSSGYFTRVFREEVGVSPREFLQGKHSDG